MTIVAYNVALLIGWSLVAVGVSLWNLAAGLATAGALLIALTILNALKVGIR